MANPLIAPFVELATSIIGFMDDELKAKSQKYVDQLVALKTELSTEEDKGYDSDDAKVESLIKQIAITTEGLNNEIQIYKAQGNQATAPVSPPPSA